jgi:hypothetical protein
MSSDSRLLPHPANYPDFVEGPISQLVSRTGYSREAVLKEYHREFDATAPRSLTQFPNSTPEGILRLRQQSAIGKIYQEMLQRLPLAEYTIVYLGHGGKKVAKGQKKPYINAYVAVKEGGALVIKRMIGNGKYADLPLTLIPLNAYTCGLGRYSGGSGDLVMDDRTTFRPVQATGWDVFTLCANLNIPIITVAEAKQNPSRKTSDGYVVSTDWRCIIGNVSGPPYSAKSKNLPEGLDIMWGTLTITDPTVVEQPFMDNQGRNVFPGLKGWCAGEFAMMVEENAYCAFFGTIDNKKDATTQIEKSEMQVNLVIPIFQTTGLEER